MNFFWKENKLVSNDSKFSNSARNGKKKFRQQKAVFGSSGGTAAVLRVATFNSMNW